MNKNLNKFFEKRSLTDFKLSIYNKINILFSEDFLKSYDKAQEDLLKLLNFVGLCNKVLLEDLDNLDNESLFILNNGLDNLFNDFNL